MAEMEVANALGSLRLDFGFEVVEVVFERVWEVEDSLSESGSELAEDWSALGEVTSVSESEAARSMAGNSSSSSSDAEPEDELV